jgi:GNAT superfamily N-acetyltransferase
LGATGVGVSLRFQSYIGPETAEVLEELAALRIAVFREWPYLYDGDLEYERRYLSIYSKKKAIVVGAFDGAALVGAATGMPLQDHSDDFRAALADSGLALDAIFYCAESVLLPTYRGQGAGHVFFAQREAFAVHEGFAVSAFCAVQRAKEHPARPDDYRPLDGFWRKRGYQPLPGAVANFSWRDVGDAGESLKGLQFWSKEI